MEGLANVTGASSDSLHISQIRGSNCNNFGLWSDGNYSTSGFPWTVLVHLLPGSGTTKHGLGCKMHTFLRFAGIPDFFTRRITKFGHEYTHEKKRLLHRLDNLFYFQNLFQYKMMQSQSPPNQKSLMEPREKFIFSKRVLCFAFFVDLGNCSRDLVSLSNTSALVSSIGTSGFLNPIFSPTFPMADWMPNVGWLDWIWAWKGPTRGYGVCGTV